MIEVLMLTAALAIGWGVTSLGDDDDDDSDASQPVTDADPNDEENPPSLIGTNTAELLVGTEQADFIDARGGNDTVRGLGRTDVIEGGTGSDVIEGEAGTDLLRGGPGRDLISGGSGSDLIFGGPWHDTITGGTEGDFILGGLGNDVIAGGSHYDSLIGEAGNDSLSGEAGDDHLIGGLGKDTLDGGSGDDVLVGFTWDRLDEELSQYTDDSYDFIDFEDADNRLRNAFISADEELLTVVDTDEGDLLIGGSGDDDLRGGADDTLTGGSGSDRFLVQSFVIDEEGVSRPSEITDFSPAEDILEIGIQPERFDLMGQSAEDFFEITTQPNSDGPGSEILVNGTVYAKVLNQDTVDAESIRVFFWE